MGSSRPVSTPLNKGIKLRKGTPEQQIGDPTYYQPIIGSLIYAVIGTRPNLAHTISLLSQFNSCPDETHLTAVKHVLRYLNGTKDWTLFYPANEKLYLEGFADADYATCLDTRRSFSGYVFSIWARSYLVEITETRYRRYLHYRIRIRRSLPCMSAISMVTEILVDFNLSVPCALRPDNTGAISITENDQVNDRTKHIDTHYHKVREEYRKGTFELIYVPTDQNLADICTKTLSRPIHDKLAALIRCAQ